MNPKEYVVYTPRLNLHLPGIFTREFLSDDTIRRLEETGNAGHGWGNIYYLGKIPIPRYSTAGILRSTVYDIQMLGNTSEADWARTSYFGKDGAQQLSYLMLGVSSPAIETMALL